MHPLFTLVKSCEYPKEARSPSPGLCGSASGCITMSEIEMAPTDHGLLIRKRTAAEHPVDRVYGILGKDALGKGLGVDEYIEEIRGR